MAVDRPLKMRDFPWEHSPDQDSRTRQDTGTSTDSRRTLRLVSDDVASESGTPLSRLPDLLRDAAGAINAAEARIAHLEEEMARVVEAAEERARAAEELATLLEKRASEAIRAAEKRAEFAEDRLAAAEAWIGRIRDLIARPI